MYGQLGAVAKAAVALKLDHLKRATLSYARDRADEGKSVVTGYAVAAGLYAAAGVFGLAAVAVGLGALFHWLSDKYGPYMAFAVVGGSLLAVALICAVAASLRLGRKHRTFPSLSSRLRVALASNTMQTATAAAGAAALTAERKPSPKQPSRDAVARARAAADDVLRAPSRPSKRPSHVASPRAATTGAAIAVGLLGWALARRRTAAVAAPRRPTPQRPQVKAET